jgi:recombination protein RecA
MVVEQPRLSKQQFQVILGSLMGDGNLSPNRRDRSGTRFRMGHGAKQAAYLDWKVSLLGNIPHSRTTNAKGAVFADFTPLPELSELREAVYFGDGKKHLTWEYLKSLTPLALAVWYMDDGGFTPLEGCPGADRGGYRPDRDLRRGDEPRLPGPSRSIPAGHVRAACQAQYFAGRGKISVLRFTTSASEKFQKLVAPYIHPSMDYKLLPRFRGQFSVKPEFAPVTPR